MSWDSIEFAKAIRKTKIGRNQQILSSDIKATGLVPVVDQGQEFIAGYSDEEHKVIRDDLPLVIFGDHTRCVKYVDFPFIIGADGTKVLKPDTDLFDPKFFYFAVLGLNVPNRGYNRHFSLLKEKFLPCPDKDEQRKIAAVLGLVQRAIEQQEQLIALTAELKKALLHKLFTEGLRGEPQKQTEIGPVPESWELVRCEELCEMITVGVVVKPASHYVATGVPAFRSFNVHEDRLVTNDLFYFSQTVNDTTLAKSKLRVGDVLVVRTGYPGTSCVVPKEYDGANCIDLVIVRPKVGVICAGYLSRFFNAPAGKSQAVASKHGLAQQHLNVSAVKRTLVPVPSLAEQDEIDSALATLQQKITLISAKKETLTDLFRTILHQLMTARIRVHELNLDEIVVGDDVEAA
jgi:type I restriction enzyme, S subunit